MGNLNFNSVESASEKTKSTFKSVEPGLNTLMISGIEPTVAATGNPGIVVTFESKEADASFNARFWLSERAVPSLQYLVEKFTGAKMNEEFDGDGMELAQSVATVLSSKLIGKSKTVIVDGETRTKEKDGKVYVNTYPTLRFAGFVDPIGKDAEPRIVDKTESISVLEASLNATPETDDSDLPF